MGGPLEEVIDPSLKERLMFITSNIVGYIHASSLRVAHFAQDPATG